MYTNKNTATVAPGVLATSNGHSGVHRGNTGSTSPNQKNGALLGDAMGVIGVRSGVSVLVGLAAGAMVAFLLFS